MLEISSDLNELSCILSNCMIHHADIDFQAQQNHHVCSSPLAKLGCKNNISDINL